jgi:hypothetical protein
LNPLEQLFIEDRGTVFPNGYNRTKGGKGGDKVGETVRFPDLKGKIRSWLSLAELCRHYGVNDEVVGQRVKRYDWTLRQALEFDPPPKRLPKWGNLTPVMVDGQRIEFDSFAAACRHTPCASGNNPAPTRQSGSKPCRPSGLVTEEPLLPVND